MAINVVFLETMPLSQLLPLLPPRALAIRPDIACLKKFLHYTYSEAYKSLRLGRPAARKFEVEWLCRLACARNHSKAIAFCRPRGKIVAVVSPGKIPKNLGAYASFSFSPESLSSLAEEYGFGEGALLKYSLEDLLIEKSAVEFLQ